MGSDMVVVEVFELNWITLTSENEEEDVYVLDLAVFGFVPRDPVDALNFITRWAETLRFDYIREPDEMLRKWGYMLSELSREKVLLKVIPKDTYYEACHGDECLWLFVDKGSPVRHVYAVEVFNRGREAILYDVIGTGIYVHERIKIRIEFYEYPPSFTKCWSIEKDSMALEPHIYTEGYCDLDPEKKELVENIVKKAKKHVR